MKSCFFFSISIAEISKVRINLFHMSAGKDPLVLPEEQGAHVSMTEKVYVPTKDYPDVSSLIFLFFFYPPQHITIVLFFQISG